MSINSSKGGVSGLKKDPLALTGTAKASAVKRNSVMPKALGGLTGLKFNKPPVDEKNASMKSSE